MLPEAFVEVRPAADKFQVEQAERIRQLVLGLLPVQSERNIFHDEVAADKGLQMLGELPAVHCGKVLLKHEERFQLPDFMLSVDHRISITSQKRRLDTL